MEFLFAPLEGITLSSFRLIHSRMFPGCDGYYTPFIAPDSKGAFKARYLKDLTNDKGAVPLIPQLLVNNPDAFNKTADSLYELGFREINLNLGCPSGTVFSKRKGAGLLCDLEYLDSLLDSIFNHAECLGYQVSIKTRMGVHHTEEFPAILAVYSKYPLAKLIIHARSRDDFYHGNPDMIGYSYAVREYTGPISYNGDIVDCKSLDRLVSLSPQTSSVMIGRGVVANPALIRNLQGGNPLLLNELKEFHALLIEAWLSEGLSPRFTMERMKNVMLYMKEMFPGGKKEKKQLFKAKTLEEYLTAAAQLFDNAEFSPDVFGGF